MVLCHSGHSGFSGSMAGLHAHPAVAPRGTRGPTAPAAHPVWLALVVTHV